MNGKDITSVMQGLVGPEDQAGTDLVTARFGTASYNYTQATTLTGTNAIELPVGQAKGNLNMTHFKYVPLTLLTADSSNYLSLLLEQATPAGVKSTIATIKSQPAGTGSWTSCVPVDVTITPASAFVSSGNSLLISVTKAGSGVTLPVGSFIIDGQYV